MTNAFVEVLRDPDVKVIPSCHDPLTARLARLHGFPAVMVAGYDLGAALAVTEPVLTAPEMVEACRLIKRSTDITVIVDVGAGFGDPVHIAQLARDLQLIGVEAVQLEDQIYPKRVHYFKDYQEHIVPLDEMLQRVEWVKRTCGDDLAVLARTDAYATHGEDEALRRVRALAEAGADAILAFPRDAEEARRLPRSTTAPVVYVNTNGNRVNRPVLGAQEAADLGYSLLVDVHSMLFAGFAAMEAVIRELAETGAVEATEHIAQRRRLEEVLDVPRLLAIEEETVEAPS